MIVKANPAGILGTGHCVPDQVWTNKDLEKMMDTSDEWIRSRTGIGARHVAPKGVNTSDLATKAGEEALKNAGIKAEDLNLIIVCTLTPDRARCQCSGLRFGSSLLGLCLRLDHRFPVH